MFIENKYYKLYTQIIKNRQIFEYQGYTEKHHIIPRSCGGTNLKSNLVSVSAREHYLLHRLLVKCTKGQQHYKMAHALF